MRNQRGANEAVVGLLVTGAILAVFAIGWAISVVLADPVGQGNQYRQNHGNVDFRNAQYRDFFDACGAIQTTETQIKTAKQNLEDDRAGNADTTTLAIDRKNLNAAINTRAAQVNAYNAKADDVKTRGFLRDNRLPSHIDVNGDNTRCAS